MALTWTVRAAGTTSSTASARARATGPTVEHWNPLSSFLLAGPYRCKAFFQARARHVAPILVLRSIHQTGHRHEHADLESDT
jgi:hypothetical protein